MDSIFQGQRKKGYKRPPFSKEWRENISKGGMGKVLSDEHRKKISLANKGRVVSKETCLKISLAKKGKPGRKMSDEEKKRRSEFMKARGIKPPNMTGHKFSREHVESSKKWKGDKAGVQGIHSWVKRNFEDPGKCEHCGKSEGRLEWSSKDHKYSRIREDWQRVCPGCHFKYDMKKFKNRFGIKRKKEALMKLWNSFQYV
jgi:hypothetical protein